MARTRISSDTALRAALKAIEAGRRPAAHMKMKVEHLVPLSVQALAVLAEMRPLTGTQAPTFRSPFYPGRPFSENTMNSALARMGYKGEATAHGMRTLFSTRANEAGHRGDVIERQLAHEDRDDVRGAYNRAEYRAERRRLMTWWSTPWTGSPATWTTCAASCAS